MAGLPGEKQSLLSSFNASNYRSVNDGSYLPVPIRIAEDAKHQDTLSASSSGLHQVTYSWHNIAVKVEVGQGNCFSRLCKKTPSIVKHILNDVNGVVQPGEFLAIMGASGAGKTTLLNVLTYRNTAKLKITGQRFLNGRPIDPDTLTRVSAYVQQDDLFIGTLTVREHLRFQALLRMDKHLTYNQRMERVDQVIHELGLSKCAKTIIGNPGVEKGISGGERKRLAFASEVLTNPPLMFCDEPTSGLDSYMAQNIVQVLKNLASSGKTVICTIHQPSSEVFAMFDRILLMGEGRVAFLGRADEALSFFASQGLPCPSNYNPADFYVHTLATVPGQEKESSERLQRICDAFQVSDVGKTVLHKAEMNVPRSIDSPRDDLESIRKTKQSPYKASWFTQFRAVLWRSWISVIKEPQVLRVKLFQTIFIAGLIALIYQGQSLSREGVMNINGVLFVFLTNMTFQNVFGVVNVFTAELPIFLREHFNGMYRTEVYYICKMLAELPLYIILPFIFVAISYFAIGLNSAVDRFFIASAIVILVANTATSFGYFTSCLAPSTPVALAISAPLIIPLLLFGGFFLNSGTVPVYFEWLKYLSWFMYANEALSINQWQGIRFQVCQKESAVPPEFGNCITVADTDIWNTLSFYPENFWRDIGCLFALIVGFRLLGYLALLAKTYRQN